MRSFLDKDEAPKQKNKNQSTNFLYEPFFLFFVFFFCMDMGLLKQVCQMRFTKD